MNKQIRDNLQKIDEWKMENNNFKESLKNKLYINKLDIQEENTLKNKNKFFSRIINVTEYEFNEDEQTILEKVLKEEKKIIMEGHPKNINDSL